MDSGSGAKYMLEEGARMGKLCIKRELSSSHIHALPLFFPPLFLPPPCRCSDPITQSSQFEPLPGC
jgi:hypothetical protein